MERRSVFLAHLLDCIIIKYIFLRQPNFYFPSYWIEGEKSQVVVDRSPVLNTTKNPKKERTFAAYIRTFFSKQSTRQLNHLNFSIQRGETWKEVERQFRRRFYATLKESKYTKKRVDFSTSLFLLSQTFTLLPISIFSNLSKRRRCPTKD